MSVPSSRAITTWLSKQESGMKTVLFVNTARVFETVTTTDTVELQWLEHLWDHENYFETGVVRTNEG